MERRRGSAEHGDGGTLAMIDQFAVEQRAKYPDFRSAPQAAMAGSAPSAALTMRAPARLQSEQAYKLDGNYIHM